ncbi:hypothetical protein MNBD_GAMMA23-1399 [hydrothermal vent metagenome]|uniref:DUF302 domain-containing protein n=1 Tax=hydrothermal vent metagenome TaxID=652676 RepID=A0A3B1A5Z0_9ZZZZ
MFKKFNFYLIVLIVFSAAGTVLGVGAVQAVDITLETTEYKFYKIEGSYEDVRVDLDYAITGTGIKVNGVSHIADMLVRTGKDLGRTKKLYEHAEAIQFCSATLSRNMMEADPMNIAFCPYIIYIFSLPNEKNIVYLGYRKLPELSSAASKKAVAAIIKTYEDIIADAQ